MSSKQETDISQADTRSDEEFLMSAGIMPANIPDEQNPVWQQRLKDREDANWKSPPDVSWEDLNHFLYIARSEKTRDSFDTAIRILEGIKEQIFRKNV